MCLITFKYKFWKKKISHLSHRVRSICTSCIFNKKLCEFYSRLSSLLEFFHTFFGFISKFSFSTLLWLRSHILRILIMQSTISPSHNEYHAHLIFQNYWTPFSFITPKYALERIIQNSSKYQYRKIDSKLDSVIGKRYIRKIVKCTTAAARLRVRRTVIFTYSLEPRKACFGKAGSTIRTDCWTKMPVADLQKPEWFSNERSQTPY